MEPEFSKLTSFEWDAGNSTKSLSKHQVTIREAEEIFADVYLCILDDPAHSKAELRWNAFGKTTEARLLVVSFTVRGSNVRVISARTMNRKERKIYEEKKSS